MEPKKLEVTTNGKYKNINLKKGLKKDEHAIITKKFVEGRPVNGKFGLSYVCSVVYGGEDVSFFLNEKAHELFKVTGGIDDQLKVSKVLYDYEYDGTTKYAEKLVFEVIE